MPGHLFELTEINGDKYSIVTKIDSETQAMELFRKTFGSTKDIYSIKYIKFIHATQC